MHLSAQYGSIQSSDMSSIKKKKQSLEQARSQRYTRSRHFHKHGRAWGELAEARRGEARLTDRGGRRRRGAAWSWQGAIRRCRRRPPPPSSSPPPPSPPAAAWISSPPPPPRCLPRCPATRLPLYCFLFSRSSPPLFYILILPRT